MKSHSNKSAVNAKKSTTSLPTSVSKEKWLIAKNKKPNTNATNAKKDTHMQSSAKDVVSVSPMIPDSTVRNSTQTLSKHMLWLVWNAKKIML